MNQPKNTELKNDMKEEIINENNIHHENDEAELDRLETNFDRRELETDESDSSKPKKMFAWILTAALIALIGIGGFAAVPTG